MSADKVKIFLEKVIQNGHLYNRFCSYKKSLLKIFCYFQNLLLLSSAVSSELDETVIRRLPLDKNLKFRIRLAVQNYKRVMSQRAAATTSEF